MNEVENDFSNWLGQWTIEELSKWQHEDPAIAKLIKAKLDGDPRPCYKDIKNESSTYIALWNLWDELQLQEEVLCRFKLDEKGEKTIKQYVAPNKVRKLILEQLHSSKLAGHLGVSKTIERVKQRFYWPKYRDEITLWCKNCTACAQKHPNKPARAPLKQDVVSRPGQRISLDIIGPLPTTKTGESYILTVVDNFTRWLECYPLKDHTAYTVADKLVTDYICRFGMLKSIHVF